MSKDGSHWDHLEWDGRTTSWPRLQTAELIGDSSSLQMAANDLATSISAHFHRSSATHPAVSLEGCSRDVAALLVDAVPSQTGYRRDFIDRLRAFVTMISRELVLRGEVMYELQFGIQPESQDTRPGRVALTYVPSGSLIHIGQRCFQVVQDPVLKSGLVPKVVALATDRIIHFSPPPRWRKSLEKMRVALILIERSERVWRERLMSGAEEEPVASARRDYDLAIARVTSELGWNPRRFREHTADYYFVVRELRWQRFCIDVRDHLIAVLAVAFAKAGRLFGEYPKLYARNLPTLTDVEQAEHKLAAGGTRFDILLQPFA